MSLEKKLSAATNAERNFTMNKIRRHVCCICGKRRTEPRMETTNWIYSPYPNKYSSLKVWACTKRTLITNITCFEKLSFLLQEKSPT